MFTNSRFPKKKQYATLPQPSPSAPANASDTKVFEKCSSCKTILYVKDLEKNLHVCSKCDHHFAFSAIDRIASLVDEGTFAELDAHLESTNPLHFQNYLEKLKQDQEKTGLKEAIITGEGTIEGSAFTIAVMEPKFRMGSMGSAVGEKITRAIEVSIEKKQPFVLFSASGGARMQEGVLSLMQMAKTSAALEKLHTEGILFVSVMTNPTTGGVSASFASLGDINLAEPGALIGFAGRRIIEQTIREKLPEDFQTAEFLLAHGQLDKVVHRNDLKHTLFNLISIHS